MTRFSKFATFVLLMLAFLPITAIAQTTIYFSQTGDLPVPAMNVTGDLVILSVGNVNVSGDISANNVTIAAAAGFTLTPQPSNSSGFAPPGTTYQITSTGFGTITGGSNFTANGNLTLSSILLTYSGGQTFNVTGSIPANHGAIGITTNGSINIGGSISLTNAQTLFLSSQGNIATGAISIDNSVNSGFAGAIAIMANLAGGSSAPFVIGGTGHSNGVNGTISSPPVNAGNNSSGVYITNKGNGGITITAAGNINVQATSSQSNLIDLDADQGTLTLPPDNGLVKALVSDGPVGYPAGSIDIKAATVSANGSTISASSNIGGAGQGALLLAASSIQVGGQNGLTLLSQGGGVVNGNQGLAIIPPQGVVIPVQTGLDSISNNVTVPSPLDSTPNPVTFSGSGPLNIVGSGDYSQLNISGYPLTFGNTGATKITANGATPSGQGGNLYISYSGATSQGTTGLQFTGGLVTLTSNGGNINVSVTGTSSTASKPVSFIADASGAFATGGIINFLDTLNSGTPTFAIGSGAGQFSFSAQGNPTQGNAGQISINASQYAFTIAKATPNPINLTVVKGVGGKINVTGKSLTDSGLGASLIADGNGPSVSGVTSDGGTISLNLSGNLLLGPSAGGVTTLSASANGNGGGGVGKGGTIAINNSGNPVTIGGDILANAGTTGTDTVNGGTIDIENVTAITLGGNVFANAAGNGIAQSIKLSGGTLTFENPTHQKFTATGAGTGAGGNISITQTTSTEILSLNNLTVSASASSTGTGNAGTIQATNSHGAVTVVDSTISAQAFGSGGNGGSVSLTQAGTPTTNHPVDLTAVAAPINVSANQTNGGLGGTLVVNHASASWDDTNNKARPLDVNSYVVVNGGPSAATDGNINLNGVNCQQWPQNFSPFPVSYWNCVNPSSPTPTDGYPGALAGQYLSSQLMTLLGASITGGTVDQLYVFKDATSYSTFFSFNPAQKTTLAGITASYILLGGHAYVNPFEKATLAVGGYQALTQEQVQESTAHELGHGVDFTYGQNNQSNNNTFVADAQNDLIQLDFSNVGTVGHRTLRAPCSTTNTAPFDGVVDLKTGNQFCNGAVLATTTYRTMTNSKILSVANSEIFPPATPVTYDEPYAQTFAYQLFVKPASIAPASSFQTPANGVFARTVPSQTYNYFACTQTWTANVLPANPQLTPPAYCTNSTSWYTPYEPLSWWTNH